jgi:hypothetical protein
MAHEVAECSLQSGVNETEHNRKIVRVAFSRRLSHVSSLAQASISVVVICRCPSARCNSLLSLPIQFLFQRLDALLLILNAKLLFLD